MLNCLYRKRIGRLDILWSVNKLARSVTEWTQACAAQHCQLFFQDSDFAGVLENSESSSVKVFCIFGSRTFVPISWMCKKQTSVSHSSTESEIISFDAGLRMDGFFVLDVGFGYRSAENDSENFTRDFLLYASKKI